jgi:IstB-like ATP binding protein
LPPHGANCRQKRAHKTNSIEALVLRLLDAEQTDLQASSLRCQLKAARFPVHRDLTGFDWSKTPLEAHHMQELAKGRYLDTA